MIFEAFVAHYNSPRLYTELKDTSIARIRVVVSSGFGASTVIYILIMCFGFSTFGAASSGYILNNYSSHDPIMTTSRFLIAFSILFTYPVTFFGTRDGVLDILKLPEEKQTSININIITIFLLLIITVLAVFTTDLGMVNAVGGGSLATLIVFVFPANMFWAAIDHRRAPPSNEEKREVVFAMILMILGLIMGIIGVVVAVS
jgi:amino acid permease